jgi:plasmid maintenance system antidote protein VapI
MEALEGRKVLQEIDPKLHLEVEEVANKLGITRKGVFYLIKNKEITPSSKARRTNFILTKMR